VKGRYVFVATSALALSFANATPVLAAEGGELPRIINFLIVIFFLVFFLRKPLAGYLSAQTDQIRSQLAKATKRRTKAIEEMARAEHRLKGLSNEIEQVRQEAKQAALAEQDRILEVARAEAKRITALAKKELETELELSRRKLMARATELSVSLARSSIKSKMTEEDQERLVNRSIELLGEAK